MRYQFSRVNLFSFVILIVMFFGLVFPLIVNNGFLIPNENELIPFSFINFLFLGIPSILVIFALLYSKKQEESLIE